MSLVSQIEATTQKYHDKALEDVRLDRSYYFAKLWKQSTKTVDGMKFTWPLKYARKSVQFIGQYEEKDIAPTEQITEAEEDFFFSQLSCILSDHELERNGTTSRKLNLLSEKLKLAREDFLDGMATAIWTGDGPDVNEPTGLDIWVEAAAVGSQTTEVANITRGTDDTGAGNYTNWWNNQSKNFAGPVTLDGMEQLRQDCTHGSHSPDMCVCDKTVYRYIWNLATGLQTEPHSDAAKLGFKALDFDGMAITRDDDVPGSSARLYMFHTPGHQLMFLKKMKRQPWKELEKLRAIACSFYTDGCFIVRSPRDNGVGYGITG